LVDGSSAIEDKDISLVEGFVGNLNLVHPDVALALDVKKALLKGITIHLFESRVDSSSKVAKTSVRFEKGLELLGLVILNLEKRCKR